MPESAQESEPTAKPIEPIAEPAPSMSLGNKLKIVGGGVLAVAGIALPFISPNTPSASAAPLPKTPGLIQPSPTLEPVAGLEGSVIVARREPLEVGVATYNWEHDRPYTLFDEMHEIGMTGTRLTLIRQRWDEDLADIWEQLPEARENDIEPTINLGQAKGAPREGFPEWAATMAEQLPGVTRFVIQNEVNSPLFSTDSMEENVDLLYKTYKAIKEVRPDAEIGGFGLASQYDPLAFLEAASAYAEKKHGGLEKIMDYLDVHIYYKPEKADVFLKDVEEIWPGLIVIGEAGYGVENSGQAYESDGFVTEEEQAEYMVELIKMLLKHPQVIAVHNYRLANSNDPMDLKTGFMTPSGERLQAYYALMRFLNSSEAFKDK